MDKEYPFHKGARVALKVVGVLLILMIITSPIGLWILWRVSQARVKVTASGVHATSITTVEFAFADVERLGVCKIPIVARGIGGALARYKVGGDHGVNVCVMLRGGKKKQVTISMYEDWQGAMDQISKQLGKPYEELEMGLFGIK